MITGVVFCVYFFYKAQMLSGLIDLVMLLFHKKIANRLSHLIWFPASSYKVPLVFCIMLRVLRI